MKLTKSINKTYDIQYVDCDFVIDDISKCTINGISSMFQTVKNLPFLKYHSGAFHWNPRIILEEGRIVCWPKGLNAIINFDLRGFICLYLTNIYDVAFEETDKVPEYLQLDLIDKRESLNFTINDNGFIENWPGCDKILSQL